MDSSLNDLKEVAATTVPPLASQLNQPDSPNQPVLIVWEHGGQLGHIARLVPVAQALRARGYPVLVATPNAAAVRPYFESAGVMMVSMPQAAKPPSAGPSLLCPADIWLQCGFANPAGAQACMVQWLALFYQFKPCAVLVDASPMAQYAAALAGLHVVVLGTGFELPPSGPGLSFAPWMDDIQNAIADSEERLAVAVAALGKLLNISPNDDWSNGSSSLLNSAQQALCTWPELDHFERALPEPAYIGPIWHALPNTLPTAASVAWPDKPGPKVLCYLRLVDKRHDFLWQALRKHQANVVVVSPAGQSWACDAARGWGITVHMQTVEISVLLPTCDAVISHGGMGLTSMALHAGKPLMLLPTQLEQALLAYQLLRRALVISTLRHQHQAQVQARVDQLLHDAQLKQRAVKFATRYAWFRPHMAVDKLVNILVGHAKDTGHTFDETTAATMSN